jgi:hypothetical protein
LREVRILIRAFSLIQITEGASDDDMAASELGSSVSSSLASVVSSGELVTTITTIASSPGDYLTHSYGSSSGLSALASVTITSVATTITVTQTPEPTSQTTNAPSALISEEDDADDDAFLSKTESDSELTSMMLVIIGLIAVIVLLCCCVVVLLAVHVASRKKPTETMQQQQQQRSVNIVRGAATTAVPIATATSVEMALSSSSQDSLAKKAATF